MKEKPLPKHKSIEAYLKDNTRPLSTEEARNYLGLSKSYFYRITSQRKIAMFRPGGKRLFFYKSDLDDWVRRNRITPEYELQEKAIENVMLGSDK